MLASVIAMAVAASSPVASDQSFITAADLLKECQSKNELQLACNGYITGVSDAHGVYEAVLKRNSVCYPEGTSIEQISAAVVSFLNGKLDHQQDGAAGLVVAALTEAYPCRK